MLRLEGIISHQHIQDPPHDKSNYSSIFDCYGLVQVYFVTILIQVRHRHNTYRFFFPSWWVTVQLVKLMSLTDYSSVPLSFTHINNKKNQWITRPHNIQKSLNKQTSLSVSLQHLVCLPSGSPGTLCSSPDVASWEWPEPNITHRSLNTKTHHHASGGQECCFHNSH